MKYSKIIFLFLLLSPLYSMAGWNAGGGIEWETVGKDSLRILVTVYRDCNESKTTKGTLILTGNCHSKTFTSFDTVVYQQNATSNCASQCTPCQGGTCTFKYGFQKTVFSKTVGLDSFRNCSNCRLEIKYISSSTRIFSITTGANNTALSYAAELNLCDTSAFEFKYADDPLFIVGLGTDNASTSHRIIANGVDSIIYSYTTPLYANGLKIPYTSYYSFEKPLYYLGFPKAGLTFPRGFSIDEYSGKLLFRPMKEEVTTFAIKAEIYKNGKYYGSTMREQALFVAKIEDLDLPKSGGWFCKTSYPTYETDVCEGATMIRTICGFDKNRNDSLTIEVLDSVKGATFTRLDVKTKNQKLLFEWTPDSTQVGTHDIRIRINDNSCPIEHSIEQVLTIHVLQKPKHTWLSSKYLGCGKVFYTLHNPDKKTLYSIHWETDLGGKLLSNTSTKDTFVVNYFSGGKKDIVVDYHIGSYYLAQCRDTLKYTSTVTDTFLQIEKSNDTIVCAGSEIDLKVKLKNHKGPTNINWSTGLQTNGNTSQVNGALIDKDSVFTINYSDKYCSLSQNIIVLANQPNKAVVSKNNFFCLNDSLLPMKAFLVKDTTDSIITINWLDSIGYLAQNTDSFAFKNGGNYYVETVDSLGCVFIDSFNIRRIGPNYVLPIDTVLCKENTYKVPFINKNATSINWYLLKEQDTILQKENSTLVYIQRPDTQLKVIVRLATTVGTNECVVFDSFNVDVHSKANQLISGPNTICLNEEIAITTTGFDKVKWYYRDTALFADTLKFKRVNNQNEGDSFRIRVKGFYANTCCTDQSYAIFYPKSIKPDFKLNDTIKNPDFFKPVNLTDTFSKTTFTWSLMADTNIVFNGFEPDIFHNGNRVFDLRLSATDSFGCTTDTTKRIELDRYVGDNVSQTNQAMVYPNPVKEQLIITNKNGIEQLYLYDLQGKEVFYNEPNNSLYKIDMQRLPKGLYLLKTSNKLGIGIIKIEKI